MEILHKWGQRTCINNLVVILGVNKYILVMDVYFLYFGIYLYDEFLISFDKTAIVPADSDQDCTLRKTTFVGIGSK